ncbi:MULTISPECIES: hypothetical protein [Trichocoleus]|uniref:Uncharacterized protein n=1 Tax=Trichocoleus desertorum GB2-A4 TaxID=2933944 RepID=A0ABV0JFR1_9CYAN|nr:hypothetical protein [Trichocoleus sp. FACHB-46]MBD1864529.1 hypothetical protein [Trichocoleus sp. FACHB-46]
MVNAQTTPNAILANLLEADTALATQEATLSAQLQGVREKRQSLKIVIDLFSIPSTPSTSPPSGEGSATSSSIAKDDAFTAATPSAPVLSALKESEAEQPRRSRSVSKSTTSPKRGRATKSSKTSKTAKSSKNWQDYLQAAFQNNSLPMAIAAVFQQQPEELLSVADLMDAVFVGSLPQEIHATIRHHILNILSAGAKEGQWYRGQRGQYSLSQV